MVETNRLIFFIWIFAGFLSISAWFILMAPKQFDTSAFDYYVNKVDAIFTVGLIFWFVIALAIWSKAED